MRFSQDFLTRLRDGVPLSQLVGRAVTWDRRKSQPGKGDFWACCPFHHEKTPSFHVDDKKGFYHCFGCHQSGDALRFLTDHDGLDFPDAVKTLADLAGVPLPEEREAEPASTRRARADRAALEAAEALYQATLWGSGGAGARDYAVRRGFSEETLRAFGFGLAPGTQGFVVRQLVREGHPEDALERAGLAVRRDGGPLRDRFRGRLMVPIHDSRGRLVGFGGRTLESREPKYLNSPETALFDKSALLFNAHRARGPAHRANRLYVVEGYLDAIALAQAGVEETVASLGTALTEAQVKLAWQLADEPVLCFDGDAAGRAAAHRAIDRILPLLSGGRSFHFLALPEGQDPDDLVRSGGRDAFEALAARATPLVEAVFERELEKGADTPERLAALESRLETIAGTIADERVGRLYRSAFREKLFQLRRHRSTPASRPAPPARRGPPLSAPAAPDRALIELERITLGLLLLRPHFIERFEDKIGAETFVIAAHAGFAALLCETYGRVLPDGTEALMAALPESGRMCLGEVWGEPVAGIGPRLKERFSILGAAPPDDFLERCLALFLDKLNLRAERAQLEAEPQRLAERGDRGEARLLALWAAVADRSGEIAEREQALADEAAAIRRSNVAGGNQPPATTRP
jgi:DNA primase